MSKIILIIIAILAFNAAIAEKEPKFTNRAELLNAINGEQKVLSVALDKNADFMYVGVKSDGTDRTGYAMYICEVSREHGLNNVSIRIIDEFKGRADKYSIADITLGLYRCS